MWTAPVAVRDGDLPRNDSPAKLFLAGMAVTLGNPKIMMFYLALLPTIIDLGSVTMLGWAELTVTMAIVLIAIDLAWAARRGAGAKAAEEQPRHADRQPRQRHHHGRRRGGDRRALRRAGQDRSLGAARIRKPVRICLCADLGSDHLDDRATSDRCRRRCSDRAALGLGDGVVACSTASMIE